VACGENHSAAVDVIGRAYCWGRGKYGQLGLGDNTSKDCPCHLASLQGHQVRQITCGGDHRAFLTWGVHMFRSTFIVDYL
jgi:E3 ubiquitin-protein ligase HERC4